MFGFYRVATAVPKVYIADVASNVQEHKKLISEAIKKSASLLLFPELSLSAYSCADLFHQKTLLDATLEGIKELQEFTKNANIVVVLGAPLLHNNRLYNCAVILQNGSLLGVVPKTSLPEYKEFYEKRWFVSGRGIKDDFINIEGEQIPFGVDLLFEGRDNFTFGIEICEDLWDVIPPSSYQALGGALLHLNLSASNELVGKASYRKSLVENQSARCVSAYVYASSGVHESTTDTLFGGHAMICENGVTLSEGKRFLRESSITYADIDVEKLYYSRIHETSFVDNEIPSFRKVLLQNIEGVENLERFIDAHPFVPSNPHTLDVRCEEIIMIQASALAKRVEHIQSKKLVIGISGGLDSTLALLVCVKSIKLLQRDVKDILAITMPGFGTTDRTYDNAVNLCKELGVELQEIDIKDACLQHFKDIAHDIHDYSVTYENTQARERTQILMDIANKEGGMVIGTGDLSEIALGWSTYNGDHMSMYGLNSSIPKTLITHLVSWIAKRSEEKIRTILEDVVATPISPELLHADITGKIEQKTEEIIGPYELHDFFLYHIIKYGATPSKVLYMASVAFGDKYHQKIIIKWLEKFIWRLFSQQFKRSCMPDGVKVGSISLSPRADWRMPSDALFQAWIDELKKDK